MAFSDRSDIHKFSATDDENLNIGAVVDDIRLGESSGPTAEATRTSDFNNGLRALMGAIKRAIFGPSLTVRGDGASAGGALALNSADNAAAVTLKGPASGATSYAGILPGTAPAQSAGGKITSLAAGAAFDTDGKLDWMDGQAYSARLTDIAALTPTSGQGIQWNGTNWVAVDFGSNVDTASVAAAGAVMDGDYSAEGDILVRGATSGSWTTKTAPSGVIGEQDIPPHSAISETTSIQLSTAHLGKYVWVSNGASITIPTGVFQAGNVITLFNYDTAASSTVSRVDIGVTIWLAGNTSSQASFVLPARGIVTLLFVNSGDECVITGNTG